MTHEIGERVGAILGTEEKLIKFFGYGVYEGDFIPEEAVGFLAEAAREQERTNPKIKLDNGKVVYGCECWWGGEESVKKRINEWEGAGYKIIVVDIDEYRKINNASDT